jgi:hypothetical protein
MAADEKTRTDQPPADPNWRWSGVDTRYSRNPNQEDIARQKRFATARETALAQPAPENAALLSHAWGAPLGLVQRLLALEQEVAFLQKTLDGLFDRLAR